MGLGDGFGFAMVCRIVSCGVDSGEAIAGLRATPDAGCTSVAIKSFSDAIFCIDGLCQGESFAAGLGRPSATTAGSATMA